MLDNLFDTDVGCFIQHDKLEGGFEYEKVIPSNLSSTIMNHCESELYNDEVTTDFDIMREKTRNKVDFLIFI
ncbi:hypothetical protein [Helicobacter sp. MIT 14-3879]|uniref:hypothetical protein n=1 Tax=Helicobacter sp. MIT 14-3879 TaxID=2040649 RepID=UPI000E1E30A0|nr:hypothetical protein [Helicobacter sp. MIT 14-3879]RDU61364.1 hypothetical protein CQA44_09190 [Helicobacter sp. MIT 14-3879]